MRYELERHTDNDAYCWRVKDTETGDRIGFGLLASDATALQKALEAEAHLGQP